MTDNNQHSELDSDPEELVPPRRSDIEAKQAIVAELLEEMECEAALLLMPAHVAWFTSGMNTRGLYADSERPGVLVHPHQRWLVCSNVDTQRLFDEELDGMGFQLKEWHWSTGRGRLLGEMIVNRRVAVDRPFPNMPLLTERLRYRIRKLSEYDRERYFELGQLLSHALEATARNLNQGDTEQEAAGHLAHRIHHRGAEASAISAIADDRGVRFRRAGFTPQTIQRCCTLQATASRNGLFVTATRTVWFGEPSEKFMSDWQAASRLSAVYSGRSIPDETVFGASSVGRQLLNDTPHEYEWREYQPGYGTGYFAAEELRRPTGEEPFFEGQPLVWQARIGSAVIADTILVDPHGATLITPPGVRWPQLRIRANDKEFLVADVLVRNASPA